MKSLIEIQPATHMNEACHMYECMKEGTDEDTVCHTYEWGISSVWMYEGRHWWRYSMLNIWMRHFICMNVWRKALMKIQYTDRGTACHTYGLGMSQVWIYEGIDSDAAYEGTDKNAACHVYERIWLDSIEHIKETRQTFICFMFMHISLMNTHRFFFFGTLFCVFFFFCVCFMLMHISR